MPRTCATRKPARWRPHTAPNTALTPTAPQPHSHGPTAPTHPMQIFWNCVVTETLVQFLWSGTSTATECDEAETVETMAAAPNATVAGAGGGCQAGNLKIITMIITGMFAAACLIATAVVCRIAFRLGNRPARRRWVGVARHAAAWAFNLGFWAGGCWVTIAYGRASRFKALPLAAPWLDPLTSDATGRFGSARCCALESVPGAFQEAGGGRQYIYTLGPQLTPLLLSSPGRCMGREDTDEVLIGDWPSDRTIARVVRATLWLGLRCCRGL